MVFTSCFLHKKIILLKSLLLGRYMRNNNIVFIFSAHHNFTGNCKYAVLAIREKFSNKKIYWSVMEQSQQQGLKKYGVKTVLYNSLEYTQILSQAKYILSDVNFVGSVASHGATQIDFWHGSPIKKIRYDAVPPKYNVPYYAKKILIWLNRKNFIQSGGSQHEANFLAQTARLPKKMAHALGTPCIAPLVNSCTLQNELEQNPHIKKLHQENQTYDKVYLYAPTFRDYQNDFLSELKFDILKLNAICQQKNIRFLIKMHPWCTLTIPEISDNVKILDSTYDDTLCIGISDVIITDYSSIYHNTLTTQKDIILMHGDIQQYKQYSRDIYEDRFQHMQGHIIDDFSDLFDIIQSDISLHKVADDIKDTYWDVANIKNPYRFLELIK